ncbi:hypothetical protein L7F22_047908 [Adiantum nelumboides]|nr:hypothetical protein [Adiantum nelumboides]
MERSHQCKKKVSAQLTDFWNTSALEKEIRYGAAKVHKSRRKGTDPSAPRNDLLERTTSGISSLARFPWGSRVLPDIAELSKARKMAQPLQLYEFEACPFCRRVREALTELDLTAEVYPCPKGSQRHRNLVRETGGKEQFPYLIDVSTGISLYESGDIVKYLFKTYGGGRKPSKGLLESTILTGWVPTLLRAGRGMSRWQAAIPEIPPKKLELFSYENNQFARIVREALCELELPYVLHNVGLGSPGSSQVQVPLLLDPNTGVRVENHEQITQYLFKNYSSQKIVANV